VIALSGKPARRWLAAAALALAAGCTPAPKPRAVAVQITGFVFAPATANAAPGDTVVWTNRDLVPHSATALDGSWDSGAIAPGGTWRHVVADGDTAGYKCAFHPNMTGRIAPR
jgi:plastocyanin